MLATWKIQKNKWEEQSTLHVHIDVMLKKSGSVSVLLHTTQRPTSQNEIEKQEISGIVCERTREPTLYRISCRLKFLEPHINHFIVYTHTHTRVCDIVSVWRRRESNKAATRLACRYQQKESTEKFKLNIDLESSHVFLCQTSWALNKSGFYHCL